MGGESLMTSKQTTRLGKSPEEGIKAPVVVASIANLPLTGLPVISGVQLVEGDRVLVKDQTDATQNGIYCAFVGNWDRANDWNKSNDVVNGQLVLDSNSGQLYRASFSGDFSINVTEVNFYIVQSFNSKDDVTLISALLDDTYQIGDVVRIKSIDGNANETTMIFDVISSVAEDTENGIYSGVSHSFVMRDRDLLYSNTLTKLLNRRDFKVGTVVRVGDRDDGLFDVVTLSSLGGGSLNGFKDINLIGSPLLALTARPTKKGFSLVQLGSVGDGVSDDTLAINYAVNSGIDTITMGGKSKSYHCDQIEFQTPLLIQANGAKFLKKSEDIINISIESNDVRFKNVIFDGNNSNVFQALVAVRLIGQLGATGFEFKDCTFQNIVGSQVFDRDQWGLQIASDGAKGIVDGCTFRNISNTNTTGVTNSGFNGGLFIVGGDDPTADPSLGSDLITVNNCRFYEMWTDNIAGDWTLSATDAIRVFSQQSLGSDDGEINYGLVFSNIFMRDIQKTGIKIAGARGVKMSNIEIDGPRRGGDTIQMLAAIRLQASDHCIIKGLKMRARSQFIFNISCSNVLIDGVQFQPQLEAGQSDGITTAAFNFQSVDGDNTSKIIISNVEASLVRKLMFFDLTGITEPGYVFHDITFNNVHVSHLEDSTSTLSVETNRVDGIEFNDCKFLDKFDNVLEIFQFRDTKGIKINNCYGEFRRSITRFVASVLPAPLDVHDVTIQNSKFKRPDTQSGDTTYSSLVLKNSNGTPLKDVKIHNVEVSVPSYDVTSNQTIVGVNLIKSHITDLTMSIRDVGVANPGTALFGTLVDCTVDGVMLKSEVGKSGTVYAIQDDSNSSRNLISNVRSDERGVRLLGDKSLVGNVAAWTQSVNDTGVGNTIGTTHLFT